MKQEALMAEKPNSAEFADQREIAMLRSRKKGNPGLRMVPEISSARAAKTLTETESDPASPTADSTAAKLDADLSEPDIDYAATSDAIIEALRKIDGHITLTEAEKKEAASILGGKPKSCTPSLIVAVIVGLILGGIASHASKKFKKSSA